MNSVGGESHLATETSCHGATEENQWLMMVHIVFYILHMPQDSCHGATEESHLTTDTSFHRPKIGAFVKCFHDYWKAVLNHVKNKSQSGRIELTYGFNDYDVDYLRQSTKNDLNLKYAAMDLSFRSLPHQGDLTSWIMQS
ncbi:hypothetical protein Tco_1347372 [Tanacetum coccineum]